jgi:hypothetical protein
MTNEELDTLVVEILNKYTELSANNFMIEYVNGYDFIGACNTTDPSDLLIQINTDFVEINDEKLIRHALLHEVAHALDYIRNDGWRINEKTNRVKYHDKEFKKICKELNISGKSSADYPVNRPDKKLKRYIPDNSMCFTFDIFNEI